MVNSFLRVEGVWRIERIGEWGVPSASSSCPMSTRPDLSNHLSMGTVTSLSFLGGQTVCSRSDAKCSIIELESKFLVARGRDLDLLPTHPSFRTKARCVDGDLREKGAADSGDGLDCSFVLLWVIEDIFLDILHE